MTTIKQEISEVIIKAKSANLTLLENGLWNLKLELKLKLGPFTKSYGSLHLNNLELNANSLEELNGKEIHFLHHSLNEEHETYLEIDGLKNKAELLHLEFSNSENGTHLVKAEVIIDTHKEDQISPMRDYTLISEIQS